MKNCGIRRCWVWSGKDHARLNGPGRDKIKVWYSFRLVEVLYSLSSERTLKKKLLSLCIFCLMRTEPSFVCLYKLTGKANQELLTTLEERD